MDAWTLFLTLDVDGDHTVGPDFALSIFKSWMCKKCQPVQCHRRISNSCQMARWFRFVSSLVLVRDGVLDTFDPPCNFLSKIATVKLGNMVRFRALLCLGVPTQCQRLQFLREPWCQRFYRDFMFKTG